MHVLKALLTVFAFLFKAVAFCVAGFFQIILFVLRNAPDQFDEKPEPGSAEYYKTQEVIDAGSRENWGRIGGDSW